MKKIYLLAAEIFAGNPTVRNELVHVLDEPLRLKQLTRKCTQLFLAIRNIGMIVYMRKRYGVRRYENARDGVMNMIASLLARYEKKSHL